MVALKHLPVSEQTWKILGKMKEAGQTYDQLLQLLILEINRTKLSEKARLAKEGKGKWYSLDEI